jgi:hypothetical protein
MVTFSDLWKNHPVRAADGKPCKDPATGNPGFPDQCAINMGVCLAASGVQLGSFKGKTCWFKGHGRSHPLLAEELANWLKSKPFKGCPAPEIHSGADFIEKTKDRTGIIFLKDYWRRGDTEASRTGDHIDLWNKNQMSASSSWIRVITGISWDGVWSDYKKAKQVLFWEIK